MHNNNCDIFIEDSYKAAEFLNEFKKVFTQDDGKFTS